MGKTVLQAVVYLLGFVLAITWFLMTAFSLMQTGTKGVYRPPADAPPQTWTSWLPDDTGSVVERDSTPLNRATDMCGRGARHGASAVPSPLGVPYTINWVPCVDDFSAWLVAENLPIHEPFKALDIKIAPGAYSNAFAVSSDSDHYVGIRWVQDRAMYSLVSGCQADASTCAKALATHAKSLSSQLPGTAADESVSGVNMEKNVITALLAIWVAIFFPVRLAARLSREKFDSRTKSENYHDIQGMVSYSRFKRVVRRIGVFLLSLAVLKALDLIIDHSDISWKALLFVLVSGTIGGKLFRTSLTRSGLEGQWLAFRTRSHAKGRGPRRLMGEVFLSFSMGMGMALLLAMLLTACASLLTGMAEYPILVRLKSLDETGGVLPGGSLEGLLFFGFGVTLLAYKVDPSFLLMFGIIVPFILVYLFKRFGKRLTAPTATERLEDDPRPPVLYLRSFDEDKVRIRATWSARGVIDRLSPVRRRRFEEILATTLDVVGPVVAISPPSTKLPPLGAARVTLSNDSWQEQVESWGRQAQIVVLGGTPDSVRAGYQWELEFVEAIMHSLPVMVVLAPHKKPELKRRWQVFLQKHGTWAESLGAMPESLQVAIHYPFKGWQGYGAPTRTDVTYAASIARATGEMRTDPLMNSQQLAGEDY